MERMTQANTAKYTICPPHIHAAHYTLTYQANNVLAHTLGESMSGKEREENLDCVIACVRQRNELSSQQNATHNST